VKYIISGPYYYSLALSIFLHIKARSFGLPLRFDVCSVPEENLDGAVLAYHPALAGILSDCDNRIPEVFFSSHRVSQPLLLLTTYPLTINRNGYGESKVTQELLQLYRNINTPMSKKLQNVFHHLQAMSIPREPFSFDILLDSSIPIEWRLGFLQSCGHFFLSSSHRILSLQDIFHFQSADFVQNIQGVNIEYLLENGIDSSIQKIFMPAYQNAIQTFFTELFSVSSTELQKAIYQLIVDVVHSPVCPHLGPIPKIDRQLSKYLYECISGKPKVVKNISNMKWELERQFSFLGGKLIQENPQKFIENSNEYIQKGIQMITIPTTEKMQNSDKDWISLIKEIDKAFAKAELLWKDILHPSY
jgi:hypothetical protein